MIGPEYEDEIGFAVGGIPFPVGREVLPENAQMKRELIGGILDNWAREKKIQEDS